MAVGLWKDNIIGRWPTAGVDRSDFTEFSVLGKRFAYQPDDMRLYELEHDEGLPECGVTSQPQFELNGLKPQMVVLLPTLACNLRCRYCFEQGCEAGGMMSFETARKAIDLINERGRTTVGFFGGEPLLAWSLVCRAADYARKKFLAPSFSLTTNGTLLDDEKAEYLAATGFSLIVSVDGPQHLHDQARPMSDGGGRVKGSYEAVVRGLECISRYSKLAKRTTLRATFDGSDEYAQLLELVVHLNELCRRYGFGGVSVEPADISEGCARGSRKVVPSERLYEEYLDVAEWYARELAAGREPKFHHFSVRLQRLQRRSPAVSECGAGVGYMAVTPEGDLHACHRMGCRIGTVDEGVRMSLQQPWRDNRYYARSGCGDCWLRNVCGGGCRFNSLGVNNDIARPDILGCWLTEVCVKCAAYVLAETNQ